MLQGLEVSEILLSKTLENKDFTIVIYKLSDIEKLFKFKIRFEYALCKVCNFEDDENTDKEFVVNPSMPEYEYREKKE